MAILAWLRKEGFGTYATIDEFRGELARRSTSAVGGLGNAVAVVPEDLAEVAQGAGQGVCADLVRDLRVARGARVAALRGLLLAGAGATLGKVFAAAFDLLGDVRLTPADRAYLSRSGLKAFLQSAPVDAVNVEILRGAAAATEAVKVIGADEVKAVLAEFPATHATVLLIRNTGLFEPLPPELEARWLDVLSRQFRAARNAPPAAKRLGTAPEWPPVLPDAMRLMLARAEAHSPAGFKPLPKEAAPAAPAQPPATAPAPADDGARARVMPTLRGRARPGAAPEPETFRVDPNPVAPERLLTRPASQRPRSLKTVRFGEQVELIATRGTRALERLVALFDVRSAIVGTEKALEELSQAAALRGDENVNGPMLDELLAFAMDAKTPSPWRRAAKTVLHALSPDRAATLPPEPTLRDFTPARPSGARDRDTR